jgi:hypothetical protein
LNTPRGALTDKPTFQLGVYSFGNTPVLEGKRLSTTSQAIRDVLEAILLAEQVGLDFFGVGEHHRDTMPISSPELGPQRCRCCHDAHWAG